MRITPEVRISGWHKGGDPAIRANLARILLAGTGKVVVLPVDQGFRHASARGFVPNPPPFDSQCHCQHPTQQPAMATPGRIDLRIGKA